MSKPLTEINDVFRAAADIEAEDGILGFVDQITNALRAAIVPVDKIPKAVNCPLDVVEIYKICLMLEDLCIREKGIGLSAVQVGIPYKLFLTRLEKTRFFVNCEYEKVGENVETVEGCLSLRDENGVCRLFKVSRSSEVIVRGLELVVDGEPKFVEIEEKQTDYAAIVSQHEIDHHNDILISKGEEVYYANKKTTG